MIEPTTSVSERCGNRAYVDKVWVEEIEAIVAKGDADGIRPVERILTSPVIAQISRISLGCPWELVPASESSSYCKLALGDTCPVADEVAKLRKSRQTTD